MVKSMVAEQFQNPSDQLVKLLINKNIYAGTKTQAVLDKFRTIIQKAFEEYINDIITERLSTVISPDTTQIPVVKERSDMVLTQEEVEVLDFVKSRVDTRLNIKYKRLLDMPICS